MKRKTMKEKEKGFDMFPIVMLAIIGMLLMFLLYIVSITQPKCLDKICPVDKHPVFFKETGCTCVNKRIQ